MRMCLQTLHLYHSYFVSGFHWVNKNSGTFNCSGRKAALRLDANVFSWLVE